MDFAYELLIGNLKNHDVLHSNLVAYKLYLRKCGGKLVKSWKLFQLILDHP